MTMPICLPIRLHSQKEAVLVNVSDTPIKLPDGKELRKGEWGYQAGGRVHFGEEIHRITQKGIHIFYKTRDKLLSYSFNELAKPPSEETFIQFLNLINDSTSRSVKARYGDTIIEDLPYLNLSSAILLYAPMDLPLDFHKTGGDSLSFERYYTKPDVSTVVLLTESQETPFWVLEVS